MQSFNSKMTVTNEPAIAAALLESSLPNYVKLMAGDGIPFVPTDLWHALHHKLHTFITSGTRMSSWWKITPIILSREM